MFRIRLFIDIAASGLIFLATAYFFTGNAVHEWIGLAAVVVLVAHNFLNRRFWTHPFSGTKKIRVAGTAFLNTSLAVAALCVLVSGTMLSDEIFPFVPAGPNRGFFARELHTISAAWLFVLCAVHAGLHAPFLSSALKNIFPKKRLQKSSPK